MSEQVVENVQGTDSKKKKKGLLVLVLAIALLGAIAFWLFASGGIIVTGEARSLIKELKKDGTATIVLDKDVVINGPIVVNGKKTITGSGKITLHEKAKIEWPELEEIKSFGGVGCATVKTHDTSGMPAMFVVSPNAELTLAGSVAADATKLCNVCQVQGSGSFTLKDKATVENGRYCNVDVQEKGEFALKGGNSLNGTKFNVINKGTTAIEGGKISGTEDKTGAAVYSASKLTMSDGTVEKSACHNVYVAAGEFEMTGGTNGFSKADGIIIKQDATASITGGTMETHVKHGIHNDGKASVGKVSVIECGITNGPKGELNVDGAYVKGTYSFALANEGGTVTAKNFSTKNCEAIAICNLSGKMDLTDINLEGGRDGNISVITGEVNINGAVLDKCREKSVSISGGKVNIKNIDVQGTTGKFNGVYVFGGELYMEDAKIADTGDCGFRVDEAGYAEVKNVTIKDTTSTAIFGGRGTIIMDGVTAENIGGHGVYNTGGKVTISNFNIKTVRNVIQQRKGETIINNIVADDMELGAYCQEGTLTINGGKFTNSASNGLRVKEKTTGGLPTLELKNVTISDVAFHGISNMGIFKGENVTIKNAGMNGFYNKDTGKATVKGLKVSNITAYGISNGLKANLNMSNVSVEKVGLNKKNNAVHNLGTIVVNGLTIKRNDRNGIYNVGKLTGKDITISDITENGIYNNTDLAKTGFKGYFDVTNVTVYNTGSQGVTNMREATLKAKNLVVYDVPENGVRNHNSGIAIIDGGVIHDVDKHGINNDSSTLTLKNFEIYDVNRDQREFNLLNNSGKLTGENITLHGKAFRALYTNAKGNVSITGLKADGAGLSNVTINGKVSESKCVVSNNAGVVTLKDSTITNAKEMGLYVISGSKTTLNNVTIDKATTHGISSQGNTTINSTNLTIKNTPGAALYCNGVMTSKNLTIDNCKNGVSCRGNGCLTLAGKTNITNTEDTGIQTWGDENNGNNNSITVSKNAIVLVDTAKGHGVVNRGTLNMQEGVAFTVKNVVTESKKGIYNYNSYGVVAPKITAAKNATITIDGVKGEAVLNRGTFLMNAESTLNVANVSGMGWNAVHNYTDGAMTLGNANISEVNIEAEATVQGNAIANRNDMTLLGDIKISGIHGSGKSINSNRNFAGITNYHGTIVGTGNVIVSGEVTEGVPNADTISFGVFTEGGSVSLGNISVTDVRKNGIHVGNKYDVEENGKKVTKYEPSTLKANNISIDNATERGIYMLNSECEIQVAESLSANKTGNQGVLAAGPITVGKDVMVSNVRTSKNSDDKWNGANGLYVNAPVKVNGNVTVDGMSGITDGENQGNGIIVTSAGTLDVEGNVTVKNITTTGSAADVAPVTAAGNGLFTRGNTNIKGNVVIDNVANGYGVIATANSLKINNLTVTNSVGKEAVYTKKATVEINGGSITGRYPAKSGSYDMGIITTDEGSSLTVKNFRIEDTGGCQYGFMSRGGGALNAEAVTVTGAGMGVEGTGSELVLAGNNTIQDYETYGVHVRNTTTMTLAEGAVLNVSHLGKLNHSEAIRINNSGKLDASNATINISDVKGSAGFGVHLVAQRVKFLAKNLTISNCEQYAIYADKKISSATLVKIDSLRVTNCGFENALYNIGDVCYTLAP